jgi:hypothetical protein
MAALTLLLICWSRATCFSRPTIATAARTGLFENLAAKGHFDVAFVDQTDADALAAACVAGRA